MSKFADIQIDAAIIKRAARGDARAHEILYRAFASPVYSLCLRFTRVPAHAEDLVQETFIEVMRSIKQYRGEAAIGSWIRRIAVTKALMFLRSAWTARSQSLVDHWDDMTPGDAASHGISRHPDDASSSGCTMSKDIRTRRSRQRWARPRASPSRSSRGPIRSCGRCSIPVVTTLVHKALRPGVFENDERHQGRRNDLRIDG